MTASPAPGLVHINSTAQFHGLGYIRADQGRQNGALFRFRCLSASICTASIKPWIIGNARSKHGRGDVFSYRAELFTFRSRYRWRPIQTSFQDPCQHLQAKSPPRLYKLPCDKACQVFNKLPAPMPSRSRFMGYPVRKGISHNDQSMQYAAIIIYLYLGMETRQKRSGRAGKMQTSA